eukprot:SAG11_NODE_6086_length_1391_cov_1.247678_1_plen_183_part_00
MRSRAAKWAGDSRAALLLCKDCAANANLAEAVAAGRARGAAKQLQTYATNVSIARVRGCVASQLVFLTRGWCRRCRLAQCWWTPARAYHHVAHHLHRGLRPLRRGTHRRGSLGQAQGHRLTWSRPVCIINHLRPYAVLCTHCTARVCYSLVRLPVSLGVRFNPLVLYMPIILSNLESSTVCY